MSVHVPNLPPLPLLTLFDAGACVVRNREIVLQQILTVSNYECVADAFRQLSGHSKLTKFGQVYSSVRFQPSR